jgi:hypothetical protein
VEFVLGLGEQLEQAVWGQVGLEQARAAAREAGGAQGCEAGWGGGRRRRPHLRAKAIQPYSRPASCGGRRAGGRGEAGGGAGRERAAARATGAPAAAPPRRQGPGGVPARRGGAPARPGGGRARPGGGPACPGGPAAAPARHA